MKKIMKLSKILLLFVTIFSYVSSPISVLAEEVIESAQKPLVLNLEATEGEGGVVEYSFTYKSENIDDYENEKEYKIELDTTVTYTNGNKEVLSEKEISVDGNTLNNVVSSYTLDSPVSEYYNGKYILDVTVFDGETEVYNTDLEYKTDYIASSGLSSKLMNELGVEVTPVKEGNYNVTEGKYTQNLSILVGELSPIGLYRISGTEEVMTGEVLRSKVFTGTLTDLTGKLFGKYSYTDSIVIEEVTENDGYEVVKTYNYSCDTTLNYGSSSDNDALFTNKYGVTFEDGYIKLPAKGMNGAESVLTVEELLEKLDVNTVLSVTNGTSEDEILSGELMNGYIVKFTNGATAKYKVVIIGDADSDNDFDNDDLTGVMEGYLEKENMPSMDVVTLEKEVEGEEDKVFEKYGTITFDDIAHVNELLKGEKADLTEREIGNINVVFGKLPELVYVGDSFEVQVLVNSEMAEEVIDGIEGTVSGTKIELASATYVNFDSLLAGVSTEKGKLVAVSSEGLSTGMVVLTLKFVAVEEGTGTINFNGNVYRFTSKNEFKLTGEINIERKFSSNSYLSSLNASVGTFDIKFDKEEKVYTLTVPYDTEKVILSGGLEDLNAKVDGLIEYELTKKKTTAIITVTAEDGSTTVYTVYIIKEKAPVAKPVVYYSSSNNYLKSLEVEGYEIDFNKKVKEYSITVKNDVTSLDIKALAEHSKARVEITGNGDFKVGENTVVITVTAEDGSTRTYKLSVTKEEKKQVVTNTDESSNTAEKVVIIILIVLVALGLLYLIFKKDDEEEEVSKTSKKEETIKNKDDQNNVNNNKDNNKKRKK